MLKFHATLISTLLILLVIPSFGQQDLYISTGLNRSSLRWTNYQEIGWKYKNGWFIGLKGTYMKNSNFEMGSEIQYSIKGWKTDGTSSGTNEFHYVDAIHTFTYKPMPYIGIYSGLNTAFLLNNETATADNIFDLGWVIGGEFRLNNTHLFLHYNHGILATENSSQIATEYNSKPLNSNVQIGVRYNFYSREKEPFKIRNRQIEVGLGTSNLSSFNALLKFELDSMKYARFNFISTNINFDKDNSNNKRLDTNFSFGFGIENRKNIDKVQLLHGMRYSVSFNFMLDDYFTFRPSVGYLLGGQYILNDRFSVGLEFAPSIRLSLRYNNGRFSNYSLQLAAFSSPTLFAAYRF